MRKLYNESSHQKLLPLDSVPDVVRAHGLRDTHSRPLVSTGKGADGTFGTSRRVTPFDAWHNWTEIEIRAGNSWPAIVLDVDGPTVAELLSTAVGDGSLLKPNWTVRRPSSGGVHAAYCLAAPVHRGERARRKPLRLLARISEWMLSVSGGDPGYAGVLAHNPYVASQDGGELRTWWGREAPYTLAELSEPIPRYWHKPRVARSALGRNCTLFESAMGWAGSERHLELPVLAYALDLNADFDYPLAVGEVRAVAKSVEKYRRGWVAAGRFYSAEEREEFARRSGVASGAARRKATAGRDAEIVGEVLVGHSIRAVAERHGLGAMTVHDIVRRDAPLLVIMALQDQRGAERVERRERSPWKVAGMSRRTWYRRGLHR